MALTIRFSRQGKVSNPYLYAKSGIWGIKVDGKQVVTVSRKLLVKPQIHLIE